MRPIGDAPGRRQGSSLSIGPTARGVRCLGFRQKGSRTALALLPAAVLHYKSSAEPETQLIEGGLPRASGML
jgi:hypothetical protein